MCRVLYKPLNLSERWPADIPQDLLCVNGWMLRAEPCRAWKVGAEAGQNDKLYRNIADPPGISGLGQPLRTVLCCGLEPDIYPLTLEAVFCETVTKGCVQQCWAWVSVGMPSEWVFTIVSGVQILKAVFLMSGFCLFAFVLSEGELAVVCSHMVHLTTPF